MKKCNSCNQYIDDNDIFCPYCGVAQNKRNLYFTVLRKYAVFSGRSSRWEFWFFTLINIAIQYIVSFIFELLKDLELYDLARILALIYLLFLLLLIIPSLALAVRRLHDVGKSGWWCLVPFVNLYFYFKDSEPYTNIYGDNPKN